MPVDVLVLKVGVELGRDGQRLVGLLLDVEDDGELLLADALVGRLGALLGQALGADDAGLRELLLPLRDENVVLNVKGDNVLEIAA